MDDYYKTILDIINDHLDDNDITTDRVSRELNITRQKMLEFRNGDTININLLFEMFSHLFPQDNMRDYLFVKQKVKGLSLRELRTLYKNQDLLLEELDYIKKYQYNEIMDDVLRKICVKNSKNLLREVTKNETNSLL